MLIHLFYDGFVKKMLRKDRCWDLGGRVGVCAGGGGDSKLDVSRGGLR